MRATILFQAILLTKARRVTVNMMAMEYWGLSCGCEVFLIFYYLITYFLVFYFSI